MVPALIVLMLIIINVMPYLNEGPMWNYRVGMEVENCQYTFWENVFAVSNIVNTDRMVSSATFSHFVDLKNYSEMRNCSLSFVFFPQISSNNQRIRPILKWITILVKFSRYRQVLHNFHKFLQNFSDIILKFLKKLL